VFRRCLGAYRSFQFSPKETRLSVGHNVTAYSMPAAEYIADFELATRRALTGADAAIMEFHFYGGLPWRECLSGLSIDRGQFFHSVYRIEQKLGRRFLLSLYPLPRYFTSSASHTTRHRAFERPKIQRWRDPWLNGGYYQPSPPTPPRPRHRFNETLIRRVGLMGDIKQLPLPPEITGALAT
jgi:hypothetical protein